MNFYDLLMTHPVILTECAISERLRRMPEISLHPTLFNTPLIYDQTGRKRLEEIYGSYLGVARDSHFPIILCAPTWRVDRNRIADADVPASINRDAVRFMQELKRKQEPDMPQVTVGALIAPRNDCYSAAAALDRQAAADFHGWQIEELARAEAEVIVAQTMPALSESLGMADRLAQVGVPYIISFVIDRFGRVLDGTPLPEAVGRIDQEVASVPAGYMVNCVYPTFINAEEQSPALFKRLIGIQANASSKDHDQLDGSDMLIQDPLPDWASNMLKLNREFGVKILGCCCGTDDTYLRLIAESLRMNR